MKNATTDMTYQGGFEAERLNSRGGKRLALARNGSIITPANRKQAKGILTKFLAANPDAQAHVRGMYPFCILIDETTKAALEEVIL